MINLKSIPFPLPVVASRIMDGEAVLVHPGKGEVKVLNELGAEIWKLLDGTRSVRQIVDELIRAYAVERVDLERDVLQFVGSLHQRDLIAIRDADENP